MADPPDLTLVIPAYNEAERLAPTLRKVLAYVDEAFSECEIIVVDDGSDDDTADIAKGVDPRVRVIRLPSNRGKGAAVRAGVLAARGRRVLFSDADLSTPIEDERKLRDALDAGADIAIASRAHPDAHVAEPQGVLRESLGKLFNLLIRLMGLTRFHDTQCGFKMFELEVAQRIFERATTDGFLFDVEILLLADRAGFEIVDVPVEWRNDPSSRLSVMTMPFEIVTVLPRILWAFRSRGGSRS